MTADIGPDEGGEAPCFAHLFEDAETSVAHAVFAQLAHDLADAVVIADGEGTIAFWNDAAVRLFGWSSAEIVGKSLDVIIPERLRQRHWNGYKEVMRSGHSDYGTRLLEVPALHREGHTISLAFTVTLLTRPGEKEPFAIAAVLRDDTERWKERRSLKERISALEASSAPQP
jgi:PAS domain S-box-containing protein